MSYAVVPAWLFYLLTMKIRTAFISLLLLTLSTFTLAADSSVWQSVIDDKSIIIMRHALAPGTGDPENFQLRQCSTQRNLSETGRQQAKSIGANFKKHGIVDAQIYSSQWCRCLDTATEMNIGTLKELPLLNSFYTNREAGPAQIKKLKQWLKNRSDDQPIVLVTHQVVITALTGVYPASGEAVIFQLTDDSDIEVLGSVAPD